MVKALSTILLVEDDVSDVMNLEQALKDLNCMIELKVASDGEKALDYLLNIKNKRPSIILLDLNTPRLSGMELLREVKQHDKLRLIPVIVLTTSGEVTDILECYRLGVSGYLLKQFDYSVFLDNMKHLLNYWSAAELPPMN